MHRRRLTFAHLLTLLALVGGLLAAADPRSEAAPEAAVLAAPDALAEPLTEPLGGLPVTFEPNQGQADDGVAFIARGAGYRVDLTPTDLALTVGTADVRMQLVGANPNTQVRGRTALPGHINHLIGNDPEQWHTGIPTFASVVYEAVYPGIDLVVRGNQGNLEYDFVVAPGADPGLVAFAFPGTDAVSLDPGGDLAITVANQTVLHRRPFIYQEMAGEQVAVAGGFVIDAVGRVGFEVAGYDTSLPLVIDPVIEYSTTLGGTGEETAYEVVVDDAGNAYVTGYTTSDTDPFPSTIGPAHQGEWDGFVVKLNNAGNVAWATYFGGSGLDLGIGSAIDGAGNVYVAGVTTSTDFPTAVDALAPAQAAQPNDPDATDGLDGFVLKLDATGDIDYSTYLGGAGSDSASGIAVDGSGRAYVNGDASSTVDFPDTSGGYRSSYQGGTSDGFVVVVSADGSAFEYATFLGGSGQEVAAGLALSTATNPIVYITGRTTSTDFSGVAGGYQETLGGSTDVYVAALDPSQTVAESQLVFATYVGGTDEEVGRDVEVDAAGNVYITGWTETLTPPPHLGQYPTTEGAYDRIHDGPWDSFVTKLLPDGSDLVYSTLLGGSVDDFALGIAVNELGEAHVAGWTTSTDFPVVDSVLGGGHSGAGDAFLARLSADGSVLAYAGLFGGPLHDAAIYVALDTGGTAYMTGTSYVTGASDADAWVRKLSPTTGDAIYVWRAPGLNGTPITLAEAQRLADFAVAEGIGTIFYDNWGCGPVGSFNTDHCPEGLVPGAEAQVAADLIPILQAFHAHGLRVEALYTETGGVASVVAYNNDAATPADAKFDAIRLNKETFVCGSNGPSVSDCVDAEGDPWNDFDELEAAVATAGSLPVFMSVGHGWDNTERILDEFAGIDVQVVQINDASYDSADGRAIEFLSSDEVCWGNDRSKPVQITVETQDVMSYILDENGNPELNPWNTFYENGPDYMETKLTEIDFTDPIPERDPDYVPPCDDPYPQPHGIAYHFYRESFGSTIFPHWALDDDGDRIAEGDPHDPGVAPVDTVLGTASSLFSDGTTSGSIDDHGHQNLMVADAENSADGIVITASYETIPIGQTTPDAATILVNPPDAGGQCNPPPAPDPATVTTLTIEAGDQVIVTCSSIHVDVVTGDVEVAFTASNGTVATTTMQQGNEVTFEPETATFTAPPDNPDPVVVTVGGEEISVEPGETVDADAAITSITGPLAPLEVDTVVDMEATLANPDSGGTYDATWDWGDGTTSAGMVDVPTATVTGEHSYGTPGVYTVALTVSDDQGSSDTDEFEFIVAYDPDAGFVTGGGWFESPPGALVADPWATGKANFGYVAKYKKGKTTPDGQTQFQFKAGDLELHSTEYDWLVVTGNDTARFKGTGSINGEGEYKFQIWSYDDPDAIRIKIWSEDEDGEETIIYDTVEAIELGGGNIKVHAD